MGLRGPKAAPAVERFAAMTAAGLLALIDTHADRLAATADGAHDWSEL